MITTTKTSLFAKLIKTITCFAFLVLSTVSWGQTTLISPTGDGGFENGTTFAANGWTVVNHTTNTWNVGTATTYLGSRAAYVSNDGGTTYAYSTGTIQTSHFYRDVTIPSGETNINLSFFWRGSGEASWDRMLVYTAPTSVTPAAGTPSANSTTLTGGTLVYTQANNTQTTYTQATFSLPASLAGTTVRLIFTWQNDGSGGTSPGVAVDNISLTSATPASYTWNATSGSAAWATATNWTPARTTPNSTDILNISNGGSSIIQTASGAVGGTIVFANNTTANFQPSATNTLTLNSLTIPAGSSMFLNGTSTAAQTIAFNTGAVNTIDGRFEIANTSGVHVLNVTNSVTTVSSTGVLAAGGTVSTTAWSGTGTSTLLINGTYEHKYTTANGTIPTATWADGSNCNIIGYTSNTSAVALGQSFWNFTWNCPSQTGAYNNAVATAFAVRNNLNLVSTGTGSFGNSSTTATYAIKNIVMTGGTFNLMSASGATYNITGDFTKTGGTMTPTGSGTFNFSGTSTSQNISLDALAANPATWRFSNPLGVTITGTGTFPTAFPIGNGTSGGVRISTTATNPVTFAGTITNGFSYNTTLSTLTYDATGSYTARATEFPATSGPASLTVGVGAGNVLAVPFSRTIANTLTMTSGDIDISSNTLTLGTSSTALGTLTWTAGAIRVATGGGLTRWFGTSSLPTAAGTAIGYFPLASGANNRNVSIYFNTATALTTAGTITVGHTNVGGISTITPVTDGAYSINTQANSSWPIATGNGITGSGTIGVRLTGGGAFNTGTVANLRLMQASSIVGTHASGTGSTPNFQAVRTGLSLAQLANTHYIGAASADMQMAFNSVASGDWNNASTWDAGSVPTCAGVVNIMNGHNVTVNSTGNLASNTTINAGGTLTIASGDVTVGCTNNNSILTNNGTLTVSGGTLNVNGNYLGNAGSTLNQSGGDMNVDGNAAGNTTNSVASGTHIFNHIASAISNLNLTGGRITILDPHANTSSSDYCLRISQGGAYNSASANHTFRFGNGVSNDNGGNSTYGFYYYLIAGTYSYGLGSIEINAGTTGTNRFVYNGTTYLTGNINIVSGELRQSGNSITCAGNITNNGFFTNGTTLTLGLYNGTTTNASPNPQTIGGTGTYRNASISPTANITSITINNSNATGVTLNTPISVSSTLTMTSGIINTSSTNLLTLGTTTVSGTLSGTPSNTNFINGPFARTFAASRTSSSFGTATLFPVGVVGATPALMSIDVNPVTNASGPVIFTAQAYNANTGSAGGGVSNLAPVTWSAIPNTTANLTSNQIRINRTDASITNTSKLLTATTANGAYEGVTGGSSATTGASISSTTQITTADYKNYFSYGDLVVCTAPTDVASNLVVSNKTTTTFTANFDPASTSATGYLVVRYSGTFTATTPVDGTIYAAGSALGGTVVGNYYTAPFTFNQSSLTANTTYTYKIYSFNNSGCAGPVYNATSYDATVTTCATTYNVPTAVSATSITTSSMIVNYTASTTAGVTDHVIDVATNSTFTNFVSGYQNLALGVTVSAGAQQVTLSGLSTATTYYIRIKAVDASGCESAYTTTLTQATDCNAEAAPTVVQNFTNFTGSAPSPTCWSEKTGTLAASSTLTLTNSAWTTRTNGFANISASNMGATINLYSTKNDWLISQPIDLGSTPGLFRLKYTYAVTTYAATTAVTDLGTHKVNVVISTDGGVTWSNANSIKQYTSTGTYSNTGQLEYINLTSYSGVIKVAFVATTTSTSPDIDFHIDDFSVEAIPAPTISTVATSVACGSSSVLTITGTELLNATTVKVGTTTFSAPFASNTATQITVNLTSAVSGTVEVTTAGGSGTSASSVSFANAPALTINAATQNNCSGVTNSTLTSLTSTVADYDTYTWSPNSDITGNATNGWTFNPSATTTYTLTASNSAGCSRTLTKTVTVNAVPSTLTVSPATTLAAAGSVTTLTATGGTISSSGVSTIGNATTLTSSTTQPTAFCNRFDHYWSQTVFTAAELQAAGVQAGNITEIRYTITTQGSATNVTDLKVRMGTTSNNTLAAFQTTGLTQVFSIATYNISIGVNTITFDTPYLWDGVSNILLDVRQTGIDSTNNTQTYYTATTGNTVLTAVTSTPTSSDAFANSAPSPTTSVNRLNTTFVWNSTINNAITWSPTTGLYTDAGATTAYTGAAATTVYASPTASATYTATATSSSGCSSSGSAVINIGNTWTGTTSSSWNTAGNWSLNTVPTSADNIVINSNGTNAPVMDVDVTIPAGKSLTISGTGTLTIAPGKTLTVAGTADFGGKLVTFKSDATGTGMLGTLTGTLTGATNVKVERFIPQGKRAFRLLSPAVTTTTFISGNWQQQTHITGGASGGFDVTETNNPSMFTYNNQAASGTGWTAIANTNATNLTAGVGYRMLVRGDRTATNITAATTDNMNAAITLSATGTLRTGTVTLNSSSTPAINNTSNTTTADYSLVGNPYQSAVDWNAVTKSGIDATYYAWDPNMGTSTQRGRYVAFNGTTNDNNLSQVGQFIQPGQAFFVKNTVSGTAGTLTFQEAHKAATGASVFRMANPNATSAVTSLSVQLYEPNELAIGGYPIDAMKAIFNSDYQNELGIGDATKLESAGENIAWFRNNTKLAIDAAAPLTATDELLVKTLRLGANKSYTFKIHTANFDSNLTPYLVDNFLNTQTEISTYQPFLTSFATTTDNASYHENRFKIVFTNAALATDTFTTQIGLYPNPSKGNGFNIQLPAATPAMVKLYNMLGQEITLTANGSYYQANQPLSTGMYHIKVTQGGQTSTLKWIVE